MNSFVDSCDPSDLELLAFAGISIVMFLIAMMVIFGVVDAVRDHFRDKSARKEQARVDEIIRHLKEDGLKIGKHDTVLVENDTLKLCWGLCWWCFDIAYIDLRWHIIINMTDDSQHIVPISEVNHLRKRVRRLEGDLCDRVVDATEDDTPGWLPAS